MALLIRDSKLYAAGALLRQLIEIEYLLFLGYKDPSRLGRWYVAGAKELRRTFSPHQMRKNAEGLFRDEEYWLHCELGGHPHPRARMLLLSYESPLPPIACLLPDAVQHLRRLWTSLRLLLDQLDVDRTAVAECSDSLVVAIGHWERVEDPIVLSFDGIAADEETGG